MPLSSSPLAPSTPGSDKRHTSFFSNGYASNPSTTPAGRPPSSVGSFTPADPPPSSIVGSSQLGSGKTLFKKKPSPAANTGLRRGVNSAPFNSIDQSKLARYLDRSGRFDLGSSNASRNPFGEPSSSPLARLADEGDQDDEYETESFDEDEDAEGLEGDGTTTMGMAVD